MAREKNPRAGSRKDGAESYIFIWEIYGSVRAQTILKVPKEDNWAIDTEVPNTQLPTKLKSERVNLRSFVRGNRKSPISLCGEIEWE